MIQKLIISGLATLLITLVVVPTVAAADTSNFQAGYIIDDNVMTNTSTMSVTDIQNFLNSKVSSCNTTQPAFTGSTGTVYNPPWICLKDFYENPSSTYTLSFPYVDTNGANQTGSRTFYINNDYKYTSLTAIYNNGDYRQGYTLKATIQNINGVVPSGAISAAQIIYNVAQQYQINPQVLIVLLQKEQGLVTDTWPAPYQYQSATGYGCPDFKPCGGSYAGFSSQLKWAATLFHSVVTQNANWYSPYTVGNNNILWSPNASCGSGSVNIKNWSTAALYDYTPYQPNAAALAAGYGTGDSCSAYGNRNFWLYFNDWFGSSTSLPTDAAIFSTSNTGPWLEYGQTQTVTVTVKNTGTSTWCADGSCSGGQLPTRLIAQNYAAFSGYDPSDPNWITSSQVRMSTPTVPSGGTAVFTFRLKAPYASISYSNRFFVNIGSAGATTIAPEANVWVGINTYAPPAPTVVSQTQQQTTAVLPSQEVAATVSIRNNSQTTWYSDTNLPTGQHPTRLQTPYYSPSSYYDKVDTNWLTPSQIKMQTSSVAPGQIAVFSFTLLGPLTNNAAPLKLIPVIDGVSILPDIGISLNVQTPQPKLDYQFVSASFPPASTTASSVSTQNATIILKNTGNTVWRSDSGGYPNPTRISTIFPIYSSSPFYSTQSGWLAPSQIAMQTPLVNPGETGTFSFAWKAPQTPGNYLQYFSMVTDGYSFFPMYGSAWRTIVTN